jgi:hypothetical protein
LWSTGLSNWVNQGSAAICIDESPYQVWNDWDASQRDLFITDKNGLVVYQQNITSGISNDIYDIIFNYLETKDVSTPYKINLHQNYPNPFNPTTLIRYDLPVNEHVSINIYDLTGKRVKSLVNTNQVAGYRSINWNATSDLGQPVSAGMYIYTIQAGEFRKTRKMVLLK